MAELIELLTASSAERDKSAADVFAERLDRLERNACLRGASEPTLTAIMSARVLLRLAEAPRVFVARSRPER